MDIKQFTISFNKSDFDRIKNGYNVINFEKYQGIGHKAQSKKIKELNKSKLLRMIKLDFLSNQDYNIISGKNRKRPKDPSNFIQHLRDSYLANAD